MRQYKLMVGVLVSTAISLICYVVWQIWPTESNRAWNVWQAEIAGEGASIWGAEYNWHGQEAWSVLVLRRLAEEESDDAEMARWLVLDQRLWRHAESADAALYAKFNYSLKGGAEQYLQVRLIDERGDDLPPPSLDPDLLFLEHAVLERETDAYLLRGHNTRLADWQREQQERVEHSLRLTDTLKMQTWSTDYRVDQLWKLRGSIVEYGALLRVDVYEAFIHQDDWLNYYSQLLILENEKKWYSHH